MFSRALFAAALLGSTLAILGCASGGNQRIANATDEGVAVSIVKGQTTREQVQAAFGAPIYKMPVPEGGEVWSYAFTRSQIDAASFIPIVGMVAGGTTLSMKQLIVWFDGSGVVSNYTFNVTNNDSRRGLSAE